MKEKSNTHLKQHKRILCQNVVRLMIRVCVFGSWVSKCKNIEWAEGELDIFTFSHERAKYTNKYHKTNLYSAFIPYFLPFSNKKSITWYITQYHGVHITFHGTRYIAKYGIISSIYLKIFYWQNKWDKMIKYTYLFVLWKKILGSFVQSVI